MNSPDEIKKGLEYLSITNVAQKVEAAKKGLPYAYTEEVAADALALIQQLEADNAKKDETIQMLQDGNASLMRMIDEECEKTVTLEAERDAALADFKLYRERNIKGECGVYACDLCKRGGRYEDWDEIKCPTGCSGVSHWEWRGVQKEE